MRFYLGFYGGDSYEPNGGALDLDLVAPTFTVAKYLLERKCADRVKISPPRDGYQITQEMIDARRNDMVAVSTSSGQEVPRWVPAQPAHVSFYGWAHIVRLTFRKVRFIELGAKLTSETEWGWVWGPWREGPPFA